MPEQQFDGQVVEQGFETAASGITVLSHERLQDANRQNPRGGRKWPEWVESEIAQIKSELADLTTLDKTEFDHWYEEVNADRIANRNNRAGTTPTGPQTIVLEVDTRETLDLHPFRLRSDTTKSPARLEVDLNTGGDAYERIMTITIGN